MRRTPIACAGLVSGLAGLLMAWPTWATTPGPQLKLSSTNTVPSCFAPATLMQHVGRANPKLDPKFRDIASLYESHGQKLGLRWDYAFFQMLAETGNLTFAGSGGRGELTKDLNNFASIRAVDSDEPDRFPDVSTGVQAHLHHIRLYAGDPVSKPAAKRTKQVENFILSWSRQLKRPVRFDDMIGRWSPNNPGYARTIETAMKDYQTAHCGGVAPVAAADEDEAPARKDARKTTKVSESPRRTPLMQQEVAAQSAPEPAAGAPPVRTVPAAVTTTPTKTGSAPPSSGQNTSRLQAAEKQGATLPAQQTPPIENANLASATVAGAASNAQCKVWSASFGGDKSVLIRVNDGQVTHFTALQVNAGREKEETIAYIAAYAKGGRSVGEFTTADQAINKAFELCPKT